MKRNFLFLLVLLFVVSGLFADDKRLYKKKLDYSLIELYEKTTEEVYYIFIYESDIEEGFNCNTIYCEDYDKIKEFLLYLLNHNINGLYTPVVTALELIRSDLSLEKKSLELNNNRFVDVRMYYLN